MIETYTVSLFGHRRLDNAALVDRALEKAVRELMQREEYIEFLVGRDGDFDLLAASVIRRCMRDAHSSGSALVWVLPYPMAELRENAAAFESYYNAIEVFGEGRHFKSAFQARNRTLVDRSDLVLYWVERGHGGAYQAMRYAERKGKKVINLADGRERPQ